MMIGIALRNVAWYKAGVNLAGVDLNLLVALDALLTERSVTRAAQRIGLSQPGMSNTLARLRRLFDDPLLVRQGAGLAPTPRAQALAGPVREALALIQGALEQRPEFDPARDHRSFTVSCSDYSVLMLIGPLVRRLSAHAPGVTLQALPRFPDAARALRAGEADLVIEPPEVMSNPELPSQRLFDDRWMCCVWEGNTQVGDAMTLDVYRRLGHLTYSMGSGQAVSLADEHIARERIARHVEFSVESFLLAPFLLQGTDLVTLVLARAGPHLRRTAAVRLLDPPIPFPTLTETLWWHPRHDADPAHAWLRERIAEIAAELDARPGLVASPVS
ncbi:MAG: LysR family transcriptional regulator [Hyphomicrobiales bacterium]|nr:LysR family transcriptional regulator [Hyphomicrobiales bacterium]